MMIWPTSSHNDFRYSWCAFLLVRRNPLIVPESPIGENWKTHPPDSEWWKSPGIWIGISSMEVAPFSGEGAIMFVIPVPLKRNTPFRRSWWTHSHIRKIAFRRGDRNPYPHCLWDRPPRQIFTPAKNTSCWWAWCRYGDSHNGLSVIIHQLHLELCKSA